MSLEKYSRIAIDDLLGFTGPVSLGGLLFDADVNVVIAEPEEGVYEISSMDIQNVRVLADMGGTNLHTLDLTRDTFFNSADNELLYKAFLKKIDRLAFEEAAKRGVEKWEVVYVYPA